MLCFCALNTNKPKPTLLLIGGLTPKLEEKKSFPWCFRAVQRLSLTELESQFCTDRR